MSFNVHIHMHTYIHTRKGMPLDWREELHGGGGGGAVLIG